MHIYQSAWVRVLGAMVAYGLCATLVGCGDTAGKAECGDGVRDGTEICDGNDLGGQSCESLGHLGGTLSCSSSCSMLDQSDCFDSLCGNGSIDGDEQCDGETLAGRTCEELGYAGGSLACAQNCTLDTTGCDPPETCGDLAVQAPEVCDGTNLGGQSCLGLGHAGGDLACTEACTWDESDCIPQPQCGNGQREGTEECDGSDLGGQACTDLGYVGGTLSCGTGCQYDESGCEAPSGCGDGTVDAGEDCDGANVGGATCQSLGHDGGTLGCTGACLFDESSCHTCGNSTLESPEVCDGTALAGATCISRGHGGGVLDCANDCSAFDEQGCYTCGNATLEGSEVCDGSDVGTDTCATRTNHPDGVLGCDAGCMAFDPAGCHTMGNGVLEGPELCDGTNLDGETCLSQTGHSEGQLACAADGLSFDDSDCHDCGNGSIEGSEQCDGADVGGATCASLGHDGGTVACNADCTLNESTCMNLPVCVVHVDLSSSAANPDGLTWATAYQRVQDGVDLAYALLPTFSECEVWVVAGNYEIFELAFSDTLDLLSGVAVYGGFVGTEQFRQERDWANNVSTLDGQGTDRVYHVVTSFATLDATLDGFTITGGSADGPSSADRRGGGLYVLSSGVTIANCLVTGNHAAYVGGGMSSTGTSPGASTVTVTGTTFDSNTSGSGGGIYSNNASLTVRDSLLTANTSSFSGAGIFADSTDPFILSGSSFIGNTADADGGGVYALSGTVAFIDQCHFEGNQALSGSYGGGGLLIRTTSAEVNDSTFIGNSTGDNGGGIHLNVISFRLSNSLIDGNTAQDEGGGLYLVSGAAGSTVENCQVTNNTATFRGGGAYVGRAVHMRNCTVADNGSNQGGGLYVGTDSDPSSVTNTVVWGNTAPTRPGLYEIGATLTLQHNDIQSCACAGSNGNIDIDPLFVGGADYHLQWFSACVDGGLGDADTPPTDREGSARYDHGLSIAHGGSGTPNYVDMGAYEYHP